jgi:Arc/MetJ-type ribon-helix-helix transcriptional regulator
VSDIGPTRRKNPKFLIMKRPEVALPFPWYIGGQYLPSHVGAPRTAKVTIRLSEAEERTIEEAVKARGYASPSAFIRAAIRNELSGHSESPDAAEQRVSAGFDRIAQEVFRVGRSQQALFALVDALTKTVLTCIPEPPADARPQAVARGRERYDRLIKSAGRSMVGDAQVAMQELTSNVSQG